MSEGDLLSELPEGWARARLDEVAEVQGGIQKQQKRRPVKNKYPFLRVANVASGRLDLREVHEVELFEGELDRFALAPGDLLVVEGNGSVSQLGRAARWKGEIKDCVHQNHLIRVRPGPAILAEFLELLWNSPVISEQIRRVAASTSGLHTLSTAKLKKIQIPLPPVAEQWRIVSALAEQLPRLDAAEKILHDSARRIEQYLHSCLHGMVSSYRTAQLGGVLAGKLANGRSVPTRAGGFPVLRLTALAGPHVDLSQRKDGDWEADDAEPFLVKAGDFLIARGNGSVSLVGRGSLVSDVQDSVAYPDTMIRVRPDTAKIDPDYLRIIWSSLPVRRQIESRARTTAGIHKVNQKILDSVEFPLPDLPAQKKLCAEWSEFERKSDTLSRTVADSKRRSASLRRSLLTEAFLGRLVPQNATDESADVLLARVRTEREATGTSKVRRRAPVPSKPKVTKASDVPPPPPARASFPTSTTQPALDLEIPS
ncbi:restriction endonuclease subunit S [Streptomyces chrestomyceticus]|uniref:restriction endonuclease subunit S n=1 Tax=Streptomyces chrestomyceticus TaxID=68185 RepID=UPI0035A85E84